MQNKGRNWTDVRLIFASISVAMTLGFWGMFASREKVTAAVDGQAWIPKQTPDQETVAQVLLPGQVIYLGAPAPAPSAPPTQPARRKRDRGGGGGSVASTGSS